MTTKSLAAIVLAVSCLTVPTHAQNASDLLQKGLHLQEAAGDVDGAIVSFRQVVNMASSTNKALAAQAQYQLVLCMLQKGDRAAAQKELAALENYFASMTDLIEKARKLLPGTTSLLPEPLTRAAVLDAVWGNDVFVTPRSIDRCVTTLRAKIEADPHNPVHIQTVRDVGYRFEL